MKKAVILFLVLLSVIGIAACSDSGYATPDQEETAVPTEAATQAAANAVGSEDPYNIRATGYYSEVFTDMGIRHQYDSVEGFGHDSEFWRVCMYNFIGKIFK